MKAAESVTTGAAVAACSCCRWTHWRAASSAWSAAAAEVLYAMKFVRDKYGMGPQCPRGASAQGVAESDIDATALDDAVGRLRVGPVRVLVTDDELARVELPIDNDKESFVWVVLSDTVELAEESNVGVGVGGGVRVSVTLLDCEDVVECDEELVASTLNVSEGSSDPDEDGSSETVQDFDAGPNDADSDRDSLCSRVKDKDLEKHPRWVGFRCGVNTRFELFQLNFADTLIGGSTSNEKQL